MLCFVNKLLSNEIILFIVSANWQAATFEEFSREPHETTRTERINRKSTNLVKKKKKNYPQAGRHPRAINR